MVRPVQTHVTLDGNSAYIVASSRSAIDILSRQAAQNGELTQLAGTSGCISAATDPPSGDCEEVNALFGPQSIATYGSENAYVASKSSNSVTTYEISDGY